VANGRIAADEPLEWSGDLMTETKGKGPSTDRHSEEEELAALRLDLEHKRMEFEHKRMKLEFEASNPCTIRWGQPPQPSPTGWRGVAATLGKPLVVPSVLAAVIVTGANLVADQPQYRDKAVLGGSNRAWDASYESVRDGLIFTVDKLLDVSEAPALTPISTPAEQLPAPQNQQNLETTSVQSPGLSH